MTEPQEHECEPPGACRTHGRCWTHSFDAAAPTPPVVEQKTKGWYFHDESWRPWGPYTSREEAVDACSVYVRCELEGYTPYKAKEIWEEEIEHESEVAYHPCTDYRPWVCDCLGACSCHEPTTKETKMKFEIYTDAEGKYRWRLTSPNGEIVGASSQGFASKESAERNAKLVLDGLADAVGEPLPPEL